MMSYPAEYPWSSYHGNALDKKIESLSLHSCCISLSKDFFCIKSVTAHYLNRFFLSVVLKIFVMQPIRLRCWGDNRFKQQIEE